MLKSQQKVVKSMSKPSKILWWVSSRPVCLFKRLIIGQFTRKRCPLDRLFACYWLLRKLWTSSSVRSVVLSVLSNSALEKFAWIVEFAIRMFTFIIKSKENYLLQFFFSCRISSSSHINFAVRISSRAVSVFPALSLRRVRLSYGTFFLMVFQGNFIRVRTGHMIKNRILH